MLFSFFMLAPVALRESWETHLRTLEKQWRGIVYIGCFMALNIALNNISLLDISLTLNQIIRRAYQRRMAGKQCSRSLCCCTAVRWKQHMA